MQWLLHYRITRWETPARLAIRPSITRQHWCDWKARYSQIKTSFSMSNAFSYYELELSSTKNNHEKVHPIFERMHFTPTQSAQVGKQTLWQLSSLETRKADFMISNKAGKWYSRGDEHLVGKLAKLVAGRINQKLLVAYYICKVSLGAL